MSFQTVYLPSIKGITRVQNSAGGTGATNASSFTILFGQSLTTGNLLGIAICSQGPQAFSISSNSTIAFEQSSPPAGDTTGSIYTHLFWGKVITGGGTLVTVTTLDGSTKTVCGVGAEYSGINIAPDTSPATTVGAPSTNISLGVITNNQPNALYLSAIGQRFTTAAVNTAWLSSPGSPFNIVQQISTNLNGTNQDRGAALLDAVVTTAAARTANATSGFVNRFAGVVATMAEIPAAVPTGASW